MAKIKWGVLGTANIARGCTIPGMKLAEDCELYAIAGRSLEKAESFKQEFGFQKAYGSYEERIADEVVERKVSIPQNYSLEIAQMCRCINGEETPHITPEFSIKNSELMDRIFTEIGY